MDILQQISLFASVASLILAMLAIGLSITFFWMTLRISERTKTDSDRISEGVNKLEVFFGKFYSDAWSEMRDTYSDIRKHVWPTDGGEITQIDEEARTKANDRISQLKEEFSKELGRLFDRQNMTDVKVASLKTELISLIENLIAKSRKVEEEAYEEILRSYIIVELSKKRGFQAIADDLLVLLKGTFGAVQILNEVRRMKRDGVLTWSTEHLGPDTILTLACT